MNKNYEFIFTSLYGSQNYNLDNENSDKDYKMAVIPSLENLILDSKQYSKIEKTKDGLVEIKDIRNTFTSFKKMSIVDLGILFSKEIITNKKYKEEINRLLDIKENLIGANPYRLYQVMLGVMTSGYKKEYKAKNMTQSIRYYDLFNRYFIENENFENALDTSKSKLYNFIKDVKFDKADKNETQKKVKKMIEITKNYQNKIPKNINYETYQKLDLILIDIFKKKIKDTI